jgi:hypothetical protein
MTYLSELRASLVEAAHRQHAEAPAATVADVTARATTTPDATARHGSIRRPAPRTREGVFSNAMWRSLHGGRAILASVALGLTGTAAGAIQVGAPLGPEPQLTPSLSRALNAPPSGEPSP